MEERAAVGLYVLQSAQALFPRRSCESLRRSEETPGGRHDG